MILTLRRLFTVFLLYLVCANAAFAIEYDAAKTQLPQKSIANPIDYQARLFRNLSSEAKIQVDEIYAKGLILFYDGDFQSALDVFKALQSTVDNTRISYLAALCHYKLGNFQYAHNDLKGILSADPDHYAARIALARLYVEKGEFTAAKKHVQYIENGPSEDDHQILLDRIKAQLDNQQEKRRHYLSLEQGVLWNSNINAGTDKSKLTSPKGTLFRFEESDRALAGWGTTTHLYGWYRVAPKSYGSVFWDTTASFYHVHYFEHDDYDYSTLRLKTGPTWKRKRYLASLPVGYRSSFDKGGLDSQELFINPALKYRINRRLAIKGAFYYGDRHYKDAADKALDKLIRRIDVSPIFYLNKTLLSATVGLLSASANSDRFGYHGAEASLYARHSFSRCTRMSIRFKHRIKTYNAPYNGWFDTRKDSKNTIHALVTRKLNENMLLGASVSWSTNNSNTELFEYERYTAGLNFTLKF